MNNSIQNLEYTLSSAIRALNRGQKQTIGFLQGHGELSGGSLYDIQRALQEFYSLEYVTIDGKIQALTAHRMNSQDSSYNFYNLFDLLIVAKPTQPFSEQDLYIIDQYVMYGGKVLWLVDALDADIDSLANRGQTIATRFPLGLDEMLFNYGVRLNSDLVMDIRCRPIPIQVGMVGEKPQFKFCPWYYFPEIVPLSDHPIVRNLDLIKTDFADAQVEPDQRLFNRSRMPIAVLLEGEFRSTWRNRLTPQFTSLEEMGYREASAPNKMIVISDGDIIKNRYNSEDGAVFPVGYDYYTQTQYANKDLILNAVNYLVGDDGLLASRSRNIKLRKLDVVKVREQRSSYQVINVVLPVLIIALAGGVITIVRRKKYRQ